MLGQARSIVDALRSGADAEPGAPPPEAAAAEAQRLEKLL